MITLHKNSQRGTANHGWAESKHSFSFAHYYNPNEMGFGSLQVLNEDLIQPNSGFEEHRHSNMEIISYVLNGALEHKDNLGNDAVLRYGDVQKMSAGSGVAHSEMNHSKEDSAHFLQIWIQPNVRNIKPSCEEKHFSQADKSGYLRLIASNDGRNNSVHIHQNIRIYASILGGEQALNYSLSEGRAAYLYLIQGRLTVNGHRLSGGDALKILSEPMLNIKDGENAEFLLFDLLF